MREQIEPMHATHPYDALTPDVVLDAIERVGLAPDGRLLALNSFENRVYQIGLEDGSFRVAKFYRPGRWSDAAIREEHAFTQELAEAEVPVAGPLRLAGDTLHRHQDFRYAVFERVGGRAPELEGLDAAAWMGRTLGRLHAIGARRAFSHRPRIDIEQLVRKPAAAVLASPLLPAEARARYQRAHSLALAALEALWQSNPTRSLRLHGDCHAGNVLWREQGPLLVDFDDARSGPAVQDLWMLMSGSEAQREALLEGYEQFRVFERGELALIPALGLMRQIHYAGWIAERWDDPAFPRAFPFAREARWWDQHIADIEAAVDAV
jgi:Ser/Thr protein kinase RdoA (MazF antagonist)